MSKLFDWLFGHQWIAMGLIAASVVGAWQLDKRLYGAERAKQAAQVARTETRQKIKADAQKRGAKRNVKVNTIRRRERRSGAWERLRRDFGRQ